jgi:MraZ protein
MTQFLGTFTGKLDRKGRVSVPSQFRGKLEALGSLDIVLRPSHRDPSVEVWPAPFFMAMTGGLERMDQFSDPLEDLSFGMYASVFETRPDGDGRLVLPEELIAHAGLVEAVSFAGLGRSFQIWEPEALNRRKAEAQQKIRERGLTIPSTVPGQVGRA